MNMQKEKRTNQWYQSKQNSKEMMKVHRAHKPHKKDAKSKHGNIWGQTIMKETRKKIFPILYTCDGYVIRPFLGISTLPFDLLASWRDLKW